MQAKMSFAGCFQSLKVKDMDIHVQYVQLGGKIQTVMERWLT